MVFVKVCGLTRRQDAEAALEAGADALGFVFWPGSPRAVQAKQSEKWLKALPGTILKVGVFVNAPSETVAWTVRMCGLDAVQLHGDEPDEECRHIKELVPVKVIRALRLKPGLAPPNQISPDIDLLLVDAYQAGSYGGTGQTADWSAAATIVSLGVPVILSGGLSALNVREAVQRVRPYGVDASSLLENSPGLKDHQKLMEFVANAKNQE